MTVGSSQLTDINWSRRGTHLNPSTIAILPPVADDIFSVCPVFGKPVALHTTWEDTVSGPCPTSGAMISKV